MFIEYGSKTYLFRRNVPFWKAKMNGLKYLYYKTYFLCDGKRSTNVDYTVIIPTKADHDHDLLIIFTINVNVFWIQLRMSLSNAISSEGMTGKNGHTRTNSLNVTGMRQVNELCGSAVTFFRSATF